MGSIARKPTGVGDCLPVKTGLPEMISKPLPTHATGGYGRQAWADCRTWEKTAGYECGRNRMDCRRTMYGHSTRTPPGSFGLAHTMVDWAASKKDTLRSTR